ncbi:MAG: hypothetical protein HOV94_17735 [Saccharothrix sp.]|nr:hypothetical protein [Saccharothrix sp.]
MTASHAFGFLTTESSRIESAWGKRTQAVTVEPSLLTPLGDITIDRLLDEASLRPPFVSFARNGKQVPDREVVHAGGPPERDGGLDRAKARSLVGAGATVAFYQVHHWIDSLGTITDRISSALRAGCETTVFHTPASNPGLAWHRDAQHVFAVQITGSKQWRVEDEAPSTWWSPGALAGGGPDTEVTSFTLRRGEVLYLPPGVAHSARATDESSTHVSFVIQEPKANDLALAMFERAAQGLRTRLDGGPLSDRGSRAAELAIELSSAIRELDVDDVLRVSEESLMGTRRPPTAPRS